jgi:hypothetical protein
MLAEANPSYGYRVGNSAIERLVENMSPEDVRREVLGIWDKTTEVLSVVSKTDWANLKAVPDLGPASAFGINATRDGWFWVVACWAETETAHVEIALGTQSEVEAFNFLTRHASKRTPLKHDSVGAAKALGDKLKKRGYAASAYSLTEATAGNAMWLGMAEERRLTHAGQPDLDTAIRGSKREDRKSGGWLLMPRSDSFDIGPAVAMSEAVYAGMTAKKKGGRVL